MRQVRFAFSFLTIVPIGPRDVRAGESLAGARAFFPLVGLFIGLGLIAVDLATRATMPPMLAAAIIVVAWVVVTRALHLDGFMDTVDAAFGAYTRDRRLEIMHDPHVGAFGVVAVVLILLVKWTAIASIPWPWRMVALALSPVVGRWAGSFAMAVFPYARDKGIGSSFHLRALPLHTIVAAASTLAISLIGGWLSVGLLVIGTFVAFGVGRWMAIMFGGLTGDSYGAIIEIVEVVVLVMMSAAAFSLSKVALGPIGW